MNMNALRVGMEREARMLMQGEGAWREITEYECEGERMDRRHEYKCVRRGHGTSLVNYFVLKPFSLLVLKLGNLLL